VPQFEVLKKAASESRLPPSKGLNCTEGTEDEDNGKEIGGPIEGSDNCIG
jgi:hypothetical protein